LKPGAATRRDVCPIPGQDKRNAAHREPQTSPPNPADARDADTPHRKAANDPALPSTPRIIGHDSPTGTQVLPPRVPAPCRTDCALSPHCAHVDGHGPPRHDGGRSVLKGRARNPLERPGNLTRPAALRSLGGTHYSVDATCPSFLPEASPTGAATSEGTNKARWLRPGRWELPLGLERAAVIELGESAPFEPRP
jgi:hypothetical protein